MPTWIAPRLPPPAKTNAVFPAVTVMTEVPFNSRLTRRNVRPGRESFGIEREQSLTLVLHQSNPGHHTIGQFFASCTIEGEHVGERNQEVFLKLLAYQRAGAVQSCFDSCFWNSELLRDFRAAHFFNAAQDENRAKVRW